MNSDRLSDLQLFYRKQGKIKSDIKIKQFLSWLWIRLHFRMNDIRHWISDRVGSDFFFVPQLNFPNHEHALHLLLRAISTSWSWIWDSITTRTTAAATTWTKSTRSENSWWWCALTKSISDVSTWLSSAASSDGSAWNRPTRRCSLACSGGGRKIAILHCCTRRSQTSRTIEIASGSSTKWNAKETKSFEKSQSTGKTQTKCQLNEKSQCAKCSVWNVNDVWWLLKSRTCRTSNDTGHAATTSQSDTNPKKTCINADVIRLNTGSRERHNLIIWRRHSCNSFNFKFVTSGYHYAIAGWFVWLRLGWNTNSFWAATCIINAQESQCKVKRQSVETLWLLRYFSCSIILQ